MKKHIQKPESRSWQDYIRPILLSSAIGIGVCALLLLGFSLLLSLKDLPHSIIDPMAVCALVVGSVAAGLACARICKEKGLLLGLVCGFILFMVLFLSGLTMKDSGFGTGGWFKLVICLFGGAIGGVSGVNMRAKRK